MNFNRSSLMGIVLAGLAMLSSCNNGEELGVSSPNETTTDQFVKIRLNLNGSSTRGTDGGFSAATAKESRIKSLTLAFYDANGAFLSSNTLAEEEISNSLAVVSTKTDAQPARLLAFANFTDAAQLFKGLSLTEAVNKVLEGTSAMTGDSCFYMTSSTYLKNGAIEYGSPIDNSNISQDYAEALQVAAVDVFLERLAAKVVIAKDGVVPTTLPTYRNGSIEFELQGMALNGINKSAYYIKHISDYGFSLDVWNSAWNVSDLHRCYWATDPNYVESDANLSAYQYFSHDQIVSNRELVEYCLENTSGAADPLKQNTTHVLIVGQYTVDALPKGTDLYLYNAKLMSDQSYISLASAKHVFYTKTAENTYSNLEPSNFSIVRCGEIGNRAASVMLQVNLDASTPLYRNVGGTLVQTTVADANQELAAEDNAVKYAEGKCYYAVPIQHLGRTGNVGEYGVVRNHLYQISVASIHNYGNGVWSHDEIIVPENQDGETDYYVGLKIQVLDWHIIAQEIDL